MSLVCAVFNIVQDHAVQNLSLAFSLAEEHFGIPQLLDPRDLVDSKPDELSVMTYISEFFHVYMNIERVRFLFIYLFICVEITPTFFAAGLTNTPHSFTCSRARPTFSD
jgi:hypothetical protein